MSTFVTFTCRVSRSIADTINELTAEAEREDGYNEFVETALRRSYLEGWDERHKTADYKVGARRRRA